MHIKYVNKYNFLDSTIIEPDDIHDDEQRREEDDKIVCVSLNVNSLGREIQKKKNDSLRNFIHKNDNELYF